jgi:hypothetical protein
MPDEVEKPNSGDKVIKLKLRVPPGTTFWLGEAKIMIGNKWARHKIQVKIEVPLRMRVSRIDGLAR